MERKGAQLLKIGELAQLMGVEAQTLRNYEQQGLLTPLIRSEAGHRLYGQEDVARVRFIKRANLAGLALVEVKELLALVAAGERGENILRLKEVLEEMLRKTEQKMEELSAFRDSLLHYRWRFEEEEAQDQR
jgi:MerR family transcriptional regulator, Zn(II)-responsive regulator of zntA